MKNNANILSCFLKNSLNDNKGVFDLETGKNISLQGISIKSFLDKRIYFRDNVDIKGGGFNYLNDIYGISDKSSKELLVEFLEIKDFGARIDFVEQHGEVTYALEKIVADIQAVLNSDKLSEKIRYNEIGNPYHPLEENLLDIIEGKTRAISIEKRSMPLELYKNRGQSQSGKREKPLEFFYRVYGDYIDEGVIYQVYLRKIDKSLYSALEYHCKKNNIALSGFLPTVSQMNERLGSALSDKPGLNISKANRLFFS